MGKAKQSAYVGLPVDEAGNVPRRHEERSEGGTCVTLAKIGVFAALLCLVVLGGTHMSCAGKHTQSHQAGLLRKHRGKESDDSDLASYWKEIHHGGPWDHHRGGNHHHHDDGDLIGPHHIPRENMLGPDHHAYHDDELPAVLRHPLHGNQGKLAAGNIPYHPHHHAFPANILNYPPDHHGKQNTVIVKQGIPQGHHIDSPGKNDMPEVLRHPHYTGQPNQKQNTVKVHAAEGRFHDEPADEPTEEELEALIAEELEEFDDEEEEGFDEEFVDAEEQDFDAEDEEEGEDFDAEDEAKDEDFDDEEDVEEEEEDFDEEVDDEEESWDSDDNEKDEFEAEILEAFEELDEDDDVVIVEEERLEVP